MKKCIGKWKRTDQEDEECDPELFHSHPLIVHTALFAPLTVLQMTVQEHKR